MHKAVCAPDNAAMLLMDHQIGTMPWTHSHDINLVKQNVDRQGGGTPDAPTCVV
jgi:hypothetical protein